jgi:hypothetical protein
MTNKVAAMSAAAVTRTWLKDNQAKTPHPQLQEGA